MAINPWPARWPIGSRAEVRRAPIKSGASFIAGELVKITSGEIEQCVADPTVVAGIACDPSADVVEAGYINYYVADQQTIWAMKGSTNPVRATHVGNNYGVAVSSGEWTLDIAETSTVVFTVVDVDTVRNLYFCKFHSDALS